MLPIFAWLIFGERAIEFSPISYETVFRNIADPVVVLDEQGSRAMFGRSQRGADSGRSSAHNQHVRAVSIQLRCSHR